MDTMWRWNQLSPVERWIAELLLRGKTNKEIGVEVFLSRARVQEYTKRIVAKTGAASTRNAITLLAEERELSLLVSVLEHAPQGVGLVQDGVCKYANRALADLSGYSVEELLGLPYQMGVAPGSRGRQAELYAARVAGVPAPSTYRTKMLRKDGAIEEVEVCSAGLIRLGGKPAILFVVRRVAGAHPGDEG